MISIQDQRTGLKMVAPIKKKYLILLNFGLHQIIDELIHILYNSSSYIDLLFTYQPNLITEPGVHPSLHFNCHHQIVFAKFNSNIYCLKPYSREVWHYKNASTDLIICAITAFNWERVFSTINTNKKVAVFNKAILISLEILLLTKLPHVAIEMN